MEQATTQTIERPRQSTTSVRCVHNLLIPPKPAYPQKQTPRIPLLPYTTKRNQQWRQSQRSISPAHKRADKSEEDDFLDEIIPGITMPHLPPHKSDIETAQRTQQNKGYDLIRDLNVIKYKNSIWHCKIATQKHFTFSDWREFWSDADFSLEQINISHYLSKEFKSQCPHDKFGRNESIRIYKREKENATENGKGMKRMRLNEVFLEKEARMKKSSSSCNSVAAVVAVIVTASQYTKIGQGKEMQQFREPMETRTGWRMMNATDKQRKRERSISKENNRLRTNNNPNYNNHKCKKIRKQMKTRHKGVQS
ncbi:MAG: hypothetical protein EZS28_021661 [Streblomastix strix]|uniref:Uncharacterized protein n=1 Tax=Streblomastix strix TaxID=222440 RepID=A0A5J4VKE2_9EUKA|nr:MAG: hypothetical protein EZS28_021661 [Streblomastix strix]